MSHAATRASEILHTIRAPDGRRVERVREETVQFALSAVRTAMQQYRAQKLQETIPETQDELGRQRG